MSDNIAYTLTDSGSIDNDHWAIRIDSGLYEGTLYQYEVISFQGEDSAGNAKFTFTYSILENDQEIENKEEFEKTLGSILKSIMESEDNNGQNGNNNTETAHPQRGIHEEGIPFSEG